MARRDPVAVMTAVRAGAIAGGVVGIVLTVAIGSLRSAPLLPVTVCTALGALAMYAYVKSPRG